MIGIYHHIDLEVLELNAQMRVSGKSRKDARTESLSLYHQLGVKEKTAEKRYKLASKPFWGETRFHDRFCEVYDSSLPTQQRTSVLCAAVMNAYPFFTQVLGACGTETQMRSIVNHSRVRALIAKKWGNTQSVGQGVQKVVQSLNRWNLLIKNGAPGLYKLPVAMDISPGIGELLIASALVQSQNGSVRFDKISQMPSLLLWDWYEFSPEKSDLVRIQVTGGVNRHLRLVRD